MLPKIMSVEFDNEYFYFVLADGRKIGEPLKKYKRLAEASKTQIEKYVISDEGVHWPDIDEDIAIEPMLCLHDLRKEA